MKHIYLWFLIFLFNSYAYSQIKFIESYRLNPSCNQCNGELTLSLSGHYTPFYAYLYELGNSRGQRNGPFYGSSLTLKGLCAKSYVLDIYDACGCSARLYIQLSSGTLNVSYTVTNANCSNSLGGITLTTSNSNYFDIWYRRSNESSDTYKRGQGPQYPISSLPQGSYSLRIKDINGCEKNINFEIKNQSFNVTPTVRDASCNMQNGDVSFNITGITYPYSIEYFGAKSKTENNITTSNPTIWQLSTGNYTFIIRDRNGCSQTFNISVGTIDNIRPVISNTKSDCDGNNGSLSILHSGAFTPYTIHYSGPGIPNGYISSVTQTRVDIPGLKAGQYVIKITDSRGCFIEKIANVENGFPWVNFESLQRDNCSKSGGFTVTGYNFTKMTIYNPDGSTNRSATTSTQVLSSLGGGIYKVIIESGACKKEYEIEVPSDGPDIEVLSQRPINCSTSEGGNIQFQIKNGTPPYILHFRHESETSYKTIQASIIITSKEGFYYINVVDQNGCSKLIKVEAMVTGGPDYKEIITRLSTCYQQNGCLNIIMSKTKLPYIITIKGPTNINDTIIYDTNFTRCNLYPGDYLVSFIDANYCKSDTTIRIEDESNDFNDNTKLQLLMGSNQSILIYNSMASNSYFQWGITCCRNNVKYDSIIGEGSNNIFYYGQGNSDTLISHLNKKNCLLWSKSYSNSLKRGCANLRYLNGPLNLPCITGIKDYSNNIKISIYPNPAKNEIFIENQSNSEIKEVEIFSLYSQQNLSFSYPNLGLNNNFLNIGSLTPGIYFVKISLKDGYFETKKILVL